MAVVNFNQDFSSLTVGCKGGYQIYTLNNCNLGHVDRIHLNEKDRELYIVERLFNSNLIALVSRETPSTLRITHFKKGSEICHYSYPRPILSVKLNRQVLVVCLADRYYVHNIRDMTILHILSETTSNPTGLCALSIFSNTALIAYPTSEQSGVLSIFDGICLNPVLDIDAHNSPLAAIAFSYKADMVATASVKGTVIRTFSIASGDKLHEFRRGLKRCVTIASLAFSQDGMFLTCSSNTETVHVFKTTVSKEQAEESVGWADYLSSAITSSAASLIPSSVSGAFNAWRAYATARLSCGGKHTVAGISTIKTVPYLLVADTDGVVHIFKLDPDNGGECELVNTTRLVMLGDEGNTEEDVKDFQKNAPDTDVMKLRLDDSDEFPPMKNEAVSTSS